MLQIFSTISRKLIWESVRETISLNLSIFLFFCFFCFIKKVSKFIRFRVFFQVFCCRILRWIFFQLNFLDRISVVDFHLFLFLQELHSRSKWRNLSGGLSFHAFSSGPWIYTEGSISSSRQKEGSPFLVPHYLGLLLPSPLRPTQVPFVVSLIFS